MTAMDDVLRIDLRLRPSADVRVTLTRPLSAAWAAWGFRVGSTAANRM
eukprot:gene16024-22820_t